MIRPSMNWWRILGAESSLASFLACIEKSISEREGKQFEEGLNSKVYVQKVWEGSRI